MYSAIDVTAGYDVDTVTVTHSVLLYVMGTLVTLLVITLAYKHMQHRRATTPVNEVASPSEDKNSPFPVYEEVLSLCY